VSECTCEPVANPWTYYGIVEPGGAFEPNPTCPEHFPDNAAGFHDWETFNAGMCGGCEACGSRTEYHVCRECGARTELLEEPIPGECDA
jgi:hypothetical protein